MRALARFEAFVENLVEGPFSYLPGGSLQPVRIAKQILREMEANQAIGPGKVYVPNRYAVAISSDDYAVLAPLAPALCDELATYAADSAAERGWSLPGPVAVSLASDPAVRRGQLRVAASSVLGDGRAAAGEVLAERTLALHISELAEAPPARLVLGGEPGAAEYPILADVVTIGRALDNDLVLEHPSVSRHHAEIRREPGGYALADLGSTNGTTVNGRAVTAARLHDGDLVQLGGVTFVFRLAPRGEQET